MQRASWAHVSRSMLSLDSACVQHILLPTREAVVCKEEYRNLPILAPIPIIIHSSNPTGVQLDSGVIMVRFTHVMLWMIAGSGAASRTLHFVVMYKSDALDFEVM